MENATNKKATILIVDDEEPLRAVVREMVEGAGYPVLVAEDAFDAYLAIGTHPEIGLVLLDVNLPYVDGAAFLRKIKKARPDIKVVMVTGEADEQLVRRVMDEESKVSADGYLTKPFSEQVLAFCIERVLVHGKRFLASTPFLKKLAGRQVSEE